MLQAYDGLVSGVHAVPQQQPDRRSLLNEPAMPSCSISLSAHIEGDLSPMIGDSDDPLLWPIDAYDPLDLGATLALQSEGSVRLNIKLAMSGTSSQAAAVEQFFQTLRATYGWKCRFTVTITIDGHMLTITKAAGQDSQLQVSCDGQRPPVVSAAWVDDTADNHMMLQGSFLNGSTIWWFVEGKRPVHYLQRAKSSAPAGVPEVASATNDAASGSATTDDEVLEGSLADPGKYFALLLQLQSMCVCHVANHVINHVSHV